MPNSNRLPRIAAILAFVLAGLQALSAIWGPIVALPLALIPLAAGIGILRKRVWSAFGLVVYMLAQLILLPVVLIRNPSETNLWQAVGTFLWTLVFGSLFLAAGRSLANSGATRGHATPWVLVSALVVLPLMCFEPMGITTGSMENTLLIGDRVMVQRIPRPTVQRGDLVVFRHPEDGQMYVKRAVGIPGDRIRITHKILYVNGAAQDEPYARHIAESEDPHRDNFPSEPNTPLASLAGGMLKEHVSGGEVVVPVGNYFMLGDNRDNTLDSRYWGLVKLSDVIGEPRFIYDSREQTLEEVSGGAFRPRRVRWERLFKRP